MNLSAIGEFGLIDFVSKKFPSPPAEGIIGIGDDCAVISQNENQSFLVTTDLLVEDVHFLKNFISPNELGFKSLAVNLSDIAAMGGYPLHVFLSLGFPAHLDMKWIEAFFEGFHSLANEYGVLLLGGDTTRSPGPIIINVAVIGKAHPQQIKLRSSAKPGDIICVTDELGDSGGGLRAIRENLPSEPDIQYLMQRHHHPLPHLPQGNWLAAHTEIHAMMDVSDGIHFDLQRIIEKSSCGGIIDLDRLPISSALHRVSMKNQWDVLSLAVSGGEDYCLLVTADPKKYEEIANEFYKKFKTSLYRIGEVTDQIGTLQYIKKGQPFIFETQGFNHFS